MARSNKSDDNGHSLPELLRELFPQTYQKIFSSGHADELAANNTKASQSAPTLGLYQVAEQRLALVYGDQLAELSPLESKTTKALHCDLCHYTRSRSEASMYRLQVSPRKSRYITLCNNLAACQQRAGQAALKKFAMRIFPLEFI